MPNRATWLAHCRCSECCIFEGPTCNVHRKLLELCRQTQGTITHTADGGLMELECFTAL